MWRDERTGTTRKNACIRETMRMMKIRAVIMFAIAQAALAKWHASRRSANIAVEDWAVCHHGELCILCLACWIFDRSAHHHLACTTETVLCAPCSDWDAVSILRNVHEKMSCLLWACHSSLARLHAWFSFADGRRDSQRRSRSKRCVFVWRKQDDHGMRLMYGKWLMRRMYKRKTRQEKGK